MKKFSMSVMAGSLLAGIAAWSGINAQPANADGFYKGK